MLLGSLRKAKGTTPTFWPRESAGGPVAAQAANAAPITAASGKALEPEGLHSGCSFLLAMTLISHPCSAPPLITLAEVDYGARTMMVLLAPLYRGSNRGLVT